ncbi:sulfate adenylyltransferase [Raoultella ornithinolytica]|nr:sulfate adenylyltransferase [Raoultella ornithinolytica]
MDQKRLTHLRQLEAESIHIIREVAAEFSNPVMMYSIGKDSSVMLHLARKAFYPGTLPFPLLHVIPAGNSAKCMNSATVLPKPTAASCWCTKTRKGWRWGLTRLFTAAPSTPTS